MRDDSHEVDKQGLIEYLITIAVNRRECAWFAIPLISLIFYRNRIRSAFQLRIEPATEKQRKSF